MRRCTERGAWLAVVVMRVRIIWARRGPAAGFAAGVGGVGLGWVGVAPVVAPSRRWGWGGGLVGGGGDEGADQRGEAGAGAGVGGRRGVVRLGEGGCAQGVGAFLVVCAGWCGGGWARP